jgi:hypothetical protein
MTLAAGVQKVIWHKKQNSRNRKCVQKVMLAENAGLSKLEISSPLSDAWQFHDNLNMAVIPARVPCSAAFPG